MALRRVPIGTINRYDNPLQRRRFELAQALPPIVGPNEGSLLGIMEGEPGRGPGGLLPPGYTPDPIGPSEIQRRQQQIQSFPGMGLSDENISTSPPQLQDVRARRGAPSAGGPVDEAIKATIPRVPGMTEAHWKAIAHIESGLDPDSNSDRSTQYKGLFQIGNKGKDSEWAKNGSGDIYNPMDNAKAAQKIFEDNAAYFKKTYGKDPTPAEGYLMHQQGRGYFKGSLTNPQGNPPPRSVGGATSDHAEFGRRWSQAVEQRAAQFAQTGASTQQVAGPGQQDTRGALSFGAPPTSLGLTPEEANLYKMHRENLVHPGNTTGANGMPRSSLLATTVDHQGRTYIVPTMRDGQVLQPSAAVDRAMSEGIQKFPSYASQEEATTRYGQLHTAMAQDTQRFQENPGAYARSAAGAGGVPAAAPKGTVLPFKPESYYQNEIGQPREIPGMLDRGPLNPYVLPITKGEDGTSRTAPPRVAQTQNGTFAVVPSVDPQGRFIPPNTINELAQTGKHYGEFDTQQNAVSFARELANNQRAMQRFNDAPPRVPGQLDAAPRDAGRFARPVDPYASPPERFANPNMTPFEMTPAEVAALGSMAPGDRQRIPEPGTYFNQPDEGTPPGQPASSEMIAAAGRPQIAVESPPNSEPPPPAPTPPTPHPGARTMQSAPTQAGQAGTGMWPSWAAPLTGGGADPTNNPTNFYGTGQDANFYGGSEGSGGGGTTFLSDIFGSGFGTGQSSSAPVDVGGGQMNLGATAPEGGMAGGGFEGGGGGRGFKPTPHQNLVQIPQMQDPNILFNQLAGPEQNYFPTRFSAIPPPPPPPPATPPGMEPPFSRRRRTRFA